MKNVEIWINRKLRGIIDRLRGITDCLRGIISIQCEINFKYGNSVLFKSTLF
ncbi:hypothetical protein GCM10007199_31440 [Fictibacillus barbaricus]|nr:hypothetical protein GCM10007199_31440 [Fictibacillus barbaricus]